MLSRIKLLCLSIVVVDLILLGVMVHYTSWLFMLAFVFISAAIGGWLLNNGFYKYGTKLRKASNVDQMPSDLLLKMLAHFSASVLLIVPGVLTDLIALLMISPAGKRLVRFFIASLFGKMFPHFSNQDYFSHASGETPAKDEIIDVRVVNAGEKEPDNGQ
ncbi:MAG: FxsA family protein [Thermoguttaceae bacterium]|jgi:UPF0716 family protein affecting phage T7 exclusion